jgi:hypothetical protein
VAKLKGAIEESMKGHQNRQTFWYALNLKDIESPVITQHHLDTQNEEKE